MTKRSLILTVMLVAVVAAGAWIAKGGVSERAATSTGADTGMLPVNTRVLRPVTSIRRAREFVGTVTAARRARLAFERSARLVEAVVDEGQAVKQGQVLARLDRRQLNARFAELKARLDQEQSTLDELTAGPRRETIAAARAEVEALEADSELRNLTLKRTETLFKRKGTSAQNLDEVRLAWKAAVARRDAAQRQLDELLAGTRVEQIAAQKAMVASTEAQLQSLQVDIDDSELTAPFDGTVVRRHNDEGDLLSPQQPVYEILESGQLEARVGVPPRLIKTLQAADDFVLRTESGELTGTLRDVVAQVDRSTRTRTAVIAVDLSGATEVTDGQLVRLTVFEDVPIEGFRVPLTALATGSRGLWHAYVAEVDADSTASVATVLRRTVEVVHTDGESAIVRGALYEGDRVIVDGLHRIVPGQVVSLDARVVAEQE